MIFVLTNDHYYNYKPYCIVFSRASSNLTNHAQIPVLFNVFYYVVFLIFYISDPPTITYINPYFPSVRRSVSGSYLVFIGHRGLVASCTALGSPAPTMEWTRNGQFVSTQNAISIAKGRQLIFRVVMLVFTSSFTEADEGNYSCAARSPNTTAFQTKIIRLESSKKAQYPYQIKCSESITSNTTFFRIRLLDTNCQNWNSRVKLEIAMNLLHVLRSAVVTECQNNCVNDNIAIVGTPSCSENVNPTALILGSVTTNYTSETARTFCALSKWYQKEPLIQLTSDSYYRLDTNCSLLIGSLDSTGCEVKVEEISSPLINMFTLQYIAVCAGWGLLIFQCCMLSTIFIIRACKARKR